MATAQEVARDLLGSMSSDEDVLLAVRWIDNRYKELVSRVRFNHLRRIGELTIPGVYTTGTVAITRDLATVTGASSLWATTPGIFVATAQPYWALRATSAWYEVSAVSGNTTLTLLSAFAENTVTTSTYVLAKRYHPLPVSARWLGQFIHLRLGTVLGEPVSIAELDDVDARRTIYGSPPCYVSVVGTTKTGNTDGVGRIMVEVYPPPKDSEILRYVYWDLPSSITVTTTIPPQIDGYILKEGAYIDYCRWMMAMREKENKPEAAGFWRNEMNAAITKWEHMVSQATRTDRAVDDVYFILQNDNSSRYVGDVRTARDQWLVNYRRP